MTEAKYRSLRGSIETLIEDLPAEVGIADPANDIDRLLRTIADKSAVAVIPDNRSRARKQRPRSTSTLQRHLIECYFPKLNDSGPWPPDKETAQNYLAFLTLLATTLWLR